MEERIQICSVTDFSELKSGTRGWPEMPVYWHTDGPCGHVSAEDFRDITHYAMQDYLDNCGIVLVYTSNIKTANVVLRGKAIDGKGKVLANSMLPVGLRKNSDVVVIQNYDGEMWSSEEIAPQGKISLPAVQRHELGHGLLASEHAPEDSGALMRPFYDRKVSMLQEWDIKAAQKIYGPPKKPVPPVTPVPTTPTTPGETVIRVRNGVVTIDNARITWLDR
jgi:hypothetical protein